MGVKTSISLEEVNTLFSSYHFTQLQKTLRGVSDTTYIVKNSTHAYILKKYEKESKESIYLHHHMLNRLSTFKLNTPLCLDENQGWYLYEKLKGTTPVYIKSVHIKAVARFLASFHSFTYKNSCKTQFIDYEKMHKQLHEVKKDFYFHYKKLELLKHYKNTNDGFIHGDLFKDNCVFDENKIGVFDFIDSGCGSFLFDIAVAFIGFDGRKKQEYNTRVFLQTYNQHAPKKIQKKDFLQELPVASAYYALIRITGYNNTLHVKDLL